VWGEGQARPGPGRGRIVEAARRSQLFTAPWPQAQGSTLRVGVASDAVDWDPQTSTTLGDQQILENIYRGLTVLDPATKQPVGELDESWTTRPTS
jgi:ABC-type transport system substrate-binding protein